ncbi:MAG TPA: CoA transferase, partial [Roseateles sp.]|nr:CoA transferase [Roseateles sp.]
GLVALLAALERRERTGQGLALDLAMQDISAWATELAWGGLPDEPQARIVEGEGSFWAELLPPLGEGRVRVLSVAEVLAHPQTAARGLLKTVTTAEGSEWQVLGCPLQLLSTPPEVRSAMPRLGFLDEALARELGLATAQEQEEAA